MGYRPEVARSNWAKGRLLQDQGRLIEAQAYLEKASALYMEMRPSGQGKHIILKEVDFESLWLQRLPTIGGVSGRYSIEKCHVSCRSKCHSSGAVLILLYIGEIS